MKRGTFIVVFVSTLLTVVRCSDYSVGGSSEVQHEMESLVDGVRGAVRDVENNRAHRDVVDLGQSLHLLEHKFAGLKSAIAHEMGSRVTPNLSHSEEAKKMVETASKLLDEMAAYRNDMEKLIVHMRDIQDSISAAKAGMADFERDVSLLSSTISKLHHDTNGLHDQHHASTHQIDTATEEGAPKHASHKWFLVALFLEFSAFGFWLYTKRKALPIGGKSLHKF